MWRKRDARYRGSRLSWAAGVVEDRGKNKIKGELEKGREGGRQRERERIAKNIRGPMTRDTQSYIYLISSLNVRLTRTRLCSQVFVRLWLHRVE